MKIIKYDSVESLKIYVDRLNNGFEAGRRSALDKMGNRGKVGDLFPS